eukprot:COSAG05_NODE_2177_length_3435_cov_2.162170_3_plen_156_part_00
MQLALFEPARQMLLQNTAALDALHLLATATNSCEGVRQAARGALMAVEGRSGGSSIHMGRDRELEAVEAQLETVAATVGRSIVVAKHVMMSYQWDVQTVIKKIVQGLRKKGYKVWLDLLYSDGHLIRGLTGWLIDGLGSDDDPDREIFFNDLSIH